MNVFGLLDVTSAFLPFMRKQRSGTVVLLGSRSSWSPEHPVRPLRPSCFLFQALTTSRFLIPDHGSVYLFLFSTSY